MSYRFYLTFLLTLAVVIIATVLWPASTPQTPHKPLPLWEIRSIDTMKYSRDLAREKSSDPNFNQTIDQQINDITLTGATHVAIATPYDSEFVLFLARWVSAARAHGLKVWFRGNLSGWEGWFNYPQISRVEHITGVVDFIKNHGELFENGDIFTACPECENGGREDPRKTGKIDEYRAFLIDEHKAVNSAFRAVGKNVIVGYPSMNYDVAKLVMDHNTTAELGGVVAIDHYVRDPAKLAWDVNEIANSSGGKVFLSEFGAPIPDIHGKMSGGEQATWIRTALTELENIPNLVGINYWVSVGGSTELWSEGKAKPGVTVLTEFYHKKN